MIYGKNHRFDGRNHRSGGRSQRSGGRSQRSAPLRFCWPLTPGSSMKIFMQERKLWRKRCSARKKIHCKKHTSKSGVYCRKRNMKDITMNKIIHTFQIILLLGLIAAQPLNAQLRIPASPILRDNGENEGSYQVRFQQIKICRDWAQHFLSQPPNSGGKHFGSNYNCISIFGRQRSAVFRIKY